MSPFMEDAIRVDWHGQILSIRDVDSAVGYMFSLHALSIALTPKKTYIPLVCVYARIMFLLGSIFKGEGPKRVSIIVSLGEDCEPLKAFLGSSLRGRNPMKTKLQQFRYQQLLEGLSLEPAHLVTTKGPPYGYCAETYPVLAHRKER